MPTAGDTHDITIGSFGYYLATGQKSPFTVTTKEPTGQAYLSEDNESMLGTAPADVTGTDGAPLNIHRIYFDKWTGIGRQFYHPEKRDGRVYMLDRYRPIADGQGLSIIPQERVYTDNTVATTNYFGSLPLVGRLFFWRDNLIYQITADGAGNFDTYTYITSTADPIVSATQVGIGDAVLCTNADSYDFDGATLTSRGIPAEYYSLYQGTLEVWARYATLYWRFPGGATKQLNLGGSLIRSLVPAYNAIWIGTDTGLWRFSGNIKASNPSAAPATLNLFEPDLVQVYSVSAAIEDFVPQYYNFFGMTAFAGWLWFNANGRVYRAKPTAVENGLVVEPQPVWGTNRGLAVCDGLLVACIANANQSQVYAWQPDPEGWFRLGGQQAGVQRYYCCPFSGIPTVRDGAVMTFAAGKETIVRWPLDNRFLAGSNPLEFGLTRLEVLSTVVLPAITPDQLASAAGIGQSQIGWVRPLRIGAEWSIILTDGSTYQDWSDVTPGGANVSYVKAQISMTNGKVWQDLFNTGSQAEYYVGSGVNSDHYGFSYAWNIQRSASDGLKYDISPRSKSGQLDEYDFTTRPDWLFRIQHSGKQGAALRRIFIDYEVAQLNIFTGRQWQLLIDLRDRPGAIQLTGQPENQQVASYDPADWVDFLMLKWKTGVRENFTDLDGRTYRVKYTGVEAQRTSAGYRPAGSGGLKPEFVVKLTLSEVFE